MSETLQDYSPADIIENVDVGHPKADSMAFVTVPGDSHVFLYLWDTDADEPVTSVIGFDAEGVGKLQDWLTNVDIEARKDPYTAYGGTESGGPERLPECPECGCEPVAGGLNDDGGCPDCGFKPEAGK